MFGLEGTSNFDAQSIQQVNKIQEYLIKVYVGGGGGGGGVHVLPSRLGDSVLISRRVFALHIKLHVHFWGRVVANFVTGPFFSLLPWVPHFCFVVLPLTPTNCWC